MESLHLCRFLNTTCFGESRNHSELILISGGCRPGVWGTSYTGNQNVFTCLNNPDFLLQSLSIT